MKDWIPAFAGNDVAMCGMSHVVIPAKVGVAELMFVISTGDSLFLAMNRSGEISTYDEIPRLRSSSFTRDDKIFSCATNTVGE